MNTPEDERLIKGDGLHFCGCEHRQQVEHLEKLRTEHLHTIHAQEIEIIRLRAPAQFVKSTIENEAAMTEENARLRATIQSRHDYGPASPGEQEYAWQSYCRRCGWNPNEHPAAKNAYVEGYCDGDSYSEGNEGRAILRVEVRKLNQRLSRAIAALRAILNEDPLDSDHREIATDVLKGLEG